MSQNIRILVIEDEEKYSKLYYICAEFPALSGHRP